MQTDVPRNHGGLLNLLPKLVSLPVGRSSNYAGVRSSPARWSSDLTRPFRWRRPAVRASDLVHRYAPWRGLIGGQPAVSGGLIRRRSELFPRISPRWPNTLSVRRRGGVRLVRQPAHQLGAATYPHDILHFRSRGTATTHRPACLVEIGAEMDSEWKYPHIRLATNREFFEVAERDLGDRVETFRGRLDRQVGGRRRLRSARAWFQSFCSSADAFAQAIHTRRMRSVEKRGMAARRRSGLRGNGTLR